MSLDNKFRLRSAFTIIEILVALGISAIMITLMLTIVVNVLQIWDRSSGQLTTGNQARLVLDELDRDISSAVIKRDTNVWFAASIQASQAGMGDAFNTAPFTGTTIVPSWDAVSGGQVKPDDASSLILERPTALATGDKFGISDMRFGQAGTWLRMFTVRPDNKDVDGDGEPDTDRLSAPRAISYQIIRVRIGEDYVYQLYRGEVRPALSSAATATLNTFAVGYDLFMSSLVTGYNRGTSLLAPNNHPSNVRRPTDQDVIANNVVDFGIVVYNSTGTVLFPLADTDRHFAATLDTSKTPPYDATSNLTRGFPAYVDIMLRILTPQGVNQIQALEAGRLTGDWWTIVEKNSQVFTKRIAVNAMRL